MLLVRGLLGGLLQLVLIGALLLIPAGTWQWPRAIQFLAAYGVALLVSIVILARVAPASLEARLEAPAAKSQPLADRLASAFLFLALFCWFVFIPVDVHRLQLLPPPEPGVPLLGAILGAGGLGILFAALLQNAFATPIVRDQSNRGQVLMDTGAYARVRHPFYLGLFLWLVGLALWLGSVAAVLALPVVLVALAGRIFVEERTLRDTLPGYADYLKRVRYRIVPWIW